MAKKRPSGYQGVPKALRPMADFITKQIRKAFSGSILGKMLRSAEKYKAKPPTPSKQKPAGKKPAAPRKKKKTDPLTSDPNLRKLLEKYKSAPIGKFVAELEKYAKGKDERLIQEFLENMGDFGRMVMAMMADRTGGGVTREIQAAVNLAAEYSDRPDVIEALADILKQKGVQVTWLPGQDQIPDRPKVIRSRPNTVPVNLGQGTPVNFPPEHPIITGDMIPAKSSNVHSYGYDLDSHSLYVRFLDTQEDGTRRGPGPIYRYFNCKPELFLLMMNSPSVGRFVWDHLRIRGTLSGHQLDYALVGVQRGYVPRKATLTAQGEAYIPRTVFSDKGNRLESRKGFEIVRPLYNGGNRGNRGKPNDGRG